MKRTISALLLCFSLLALPARAVEGDLPTAGNAYPGYADVQEADWFYDAAVLCYETGLITGSAAGFEPYREMTNAEAAVIAARLCEAATGETIELGAPPPGETLPWYHWHLAYLEARGVAAAGAPEDRATRAGFLGLLSAVLPDALLAPINTVTELPDTADGDVLRFYNAGILTGTDKYGSFQGEKSLTRAEAAAMVARVARPALRLSFVPADFSPFRAAELAPGEALFTNGKTAEDFLPAALRLIEGLEADCAGEGLAFNWFNTVDGVTFLDYVKNGALAAVGAEKEQGTRAYQSFDVQVFYSRYLDLNSANSDSAE